MGVPGAEAPSRAVAREARVPGVAAGPCGAVTGVLSRSADSRRDGLRRGRRGEEAHVDGRLLCAGPRGHGAVPLLDEAQRGQCPAQGHAAGDVVGRGAELLGLWPTSSAQSALCPVTAEPEWPRCPPGGGRSAVPPCRGRCVTPGVRARAGSVRSPRECGSPLSSRCSRGSSPPTQGPCRVLCDLPGGHAWAPETCSASPSSRALELGAAGGGPGSSTPLLRPPRL